MAVILNQIKSSPIRQKMALALDYTLGDFHAWIQFVTNRPVQAIKTSRAALKRWLQELGQPDTPHKGRIMIAAVRNQRWVEWAIFSALYLLRKGYQPIILYSSEEVNLLYKPKYPHEYFGKSFWQIAKTISYLQFVDLDKYEYTGTFPAGYEDFLERAAHTVVAYDLRLEEYEPELDPERYEQGLQSARRMLAKNLIAFEQIVHDYDVKRFISPSGLIGKTMAFCEVTQRLGIKSFYIEAWSMRPGHILWGVNRPALEFDIQGWLRVLGEWTDEHEKDARNYMAFREGEKLDRIGWLENFHQVQPTQKEIPLPTDVENFLKRPGKFFLLGTNVVGDSATLRRSLIFRSQQEWIKEIIDFFKAHPEYNLIIRIHPDEIWARARVHLGKIAAQVAQGIPNILIVDSKHKVNTYALVDHIDVGLAWVSNIGLDMALRGKPVILAARANYSSLNICHQPETKQAYFESLVRMAEHPVVATPEQVRLGKAYHYIVFKIMSLEADSPRYLSIDYRLDPDSASPERETFYKVMAGELPDLIYG